MDSVGISVLAQLIEIQTLKTEGLSFWSPQWRSVSLLIEIQTLEEKVCHFNWIALFIEPFKYEIRWG